MTNITEKITITTMVSTLTFEHLISTLTEMVQKRKQTKEKKYIFYNNLFSFACIFDLLN